MSVCLSGYAFSPLTTYGNETWHGGRGQGPIRSEGHQRSKVGSNFRLLGLSSRSPPRPSEVKGQVKFQVARIELKLGEEDARPKASAKCVSRRMPSEVK